MAHVEHQQLVDVVDQPAAVVEPQRRDAKALVPDLRRPGIVGAVRGAADVALMRAVDRPEGEPVAVEDRHEGGQVRQVVAAAVGVVEQIDVAGMDAALEEVVHRLHRPGQRADMDRHVLGLGDKPALGIAERGGEVAARIEDLRVGGPQHGLAHLLDDGAQPVLHDGDGHGVDRRHQAILRTGRTKRRAR